MTKCRLGFLRRQGAHYNDEKNKSQQNFVVRSRACKNSGTVIGWSGAQLYHLAAVWGILNSQVVTVLEEYSWLSKKMVPGAKAIVPVIPAIPEAHNASANVCVLAISVAGTAIFLFVENE